jgi:hypothetical protein
VREQQMRRELDDSDCAFQPSPPYPDHTPKPPCQRPEQERQDPQPRCSPPSLSLVDPVPSARFKACSQAPPAADEEREGY